MTNDEQRHTRPNPSLDRHKPDLKQRKKPIAAIGLYIILSLIFIFFGGVCLYIFLIQADRLIALGLAGNLYYLMLLPIALSVSLVLFGVLKSYAYYRGDLNDCDAEVLGGLKLGRLALGGPIVGFTLVVIGGFMLVPNPSPFSLTVFVHGEAGLHEIVLRNSGHIVLDLGQDRRSEKINDKGQAYFPEIPANFRGQEVSVWVEADVYESIDPDKKQRLNRSSIYIPVRKKAGLIFGRVQNEQGKPVIGANVSVADLSVKTNRFGRFVLSIPGDRMQSEFPLYAIKHGFSPWQGSTVPGANEVIIILHYAP